jgi:hypothetical protein
MFQGDQPLAMKCYKHGLEGIIIESISAMLNIGRKDAFTCLLRYYKHSKDKNAEIIGKDELLGYSIRLKCWEFHEIVMGQMKDFIFMENGINTLVTKLQRTLGAAPRKLIITGEGTRIPEIQELFETKLNIKCEIKNWGSAGLNGNIPATAYGMLRKIASDARTANGF